MATCDPAPVDALVTQLLPCPHCAGEAQTYPIRALSGFVTSCQECGASVSESDPQRSVLLWNTRASDTTAERRGYQAGMRAVTKALAAIPAAEQRGYQAATERAAKIAENISPDADGREPESAFDSGRYSGSREAARLIRGTDHVE